MQILNMDIYILQDFFAFLTVCSEKRFCSGRI